MIDTFSRMIDTFSDFLDLFIGPPFDPPLTKVTKKKRKLKNDIMRLKQNRRPCACGEPDCYIIPENPARSSMEVYGKQYTVLCGYSRLLNDVAMLRKTLEFYANPENWKFNESNYRKSPVSNCIEDNGRLATEALNKIKE